MQTDVLGADGTMRYKAKLELVHQIEANKSTHDAPKKWLHLILVEAIISAQITPTIIFNTAKSIQLH